MQIGIPKESLSGETRVAATPATIKQLSKLGFDLVVQAGAGLLSSFDDAAYHDAGARIDESHSNKGKAKDGNTVWHSEFIFKVNAPNEDEINLLQAGTTLVSFIWPAQHPELVAKLAEKQVTVMAMDMVPRISRAQSLDALSSMANIGGYRAVVEAAHEFGRFFTGQITAAGKVPPAKVLVIGAGVAGLAAIGAAGSLGAIVRAFDTRLEVAEQIESMGGEFLKLEFENSEGGSADGYAKVMSDEFIAAEMALFAEQAKEVDIIITTALIPGRPAPKLITKAMVDSMKSGSVVVDLAAATGGNCEYTVTGEKIITANGVKILGYTDLPGRLAAQSSQLYGTNLVNLMKLMCKAKDGAALLDLEDVVMRNMTVTNLGEVTFPPPAISVSAAPPKPAASVADKPKQEEAPSKLKWVLAALGLAGFAAVASVAPPEFLSHFTVFVLACVVGYYVVWNVSHSLHTPLMSVTNAISGIIVVGALLQIGQGSTLVTVLAFIAVLIASINIFGGFTVTQRMLKMFRKD
ncbi:Re/Si-specific NAD(P)(+) transhydrogenase subunit alpha [Shewanella sp. SR44-3]|uniref:Re/Si-specific NAD(P)(+) transhydrogenase subunit alpha n=1 Tax=Shewanella sp. SR44-3 TaxID=2760936 RepID=UPI0015FA3A38|nr:Re/Si-specific NAD(P)(+) transhydrogenase subunit alpha [Shewanella sp. SR44-3]MBB1269529.1 Re/Si-specific NAD(P)(+) transhydrogenase subunit alpha [Shewanella sp. SR44-3]